MFFLRRPKLLTAFENFTALNDDNFVNILGPVVYRVDNAIHRKNCYPVDK